MKSSRPEGPKAGPKGRQLEVGPRRGPRLLVLNIAQLSNKKILSFTGVQHRRAGECGRASSSSRPWQRSGRWRGHARPLQVAPKRSFKCFAPLLPLRIVGSNYGLFGVSEDSGKLELTASPDREQRDMYILRVKVDIVFCLTSVRFFIIGLLQGKGKRSTFTIAYCCLKDTMTDTMTEVVNSPKA